MSEKADIIARYEMEHNIPEVSRFTEYVDEYQENMLKMGIKPKFVEDRYNEALKERDKKEKKDLPVAVFYIEDEHNLKDTATYSMDNIENMFSDFACRKIKERKLGIKIEDDVFYLVRQLDSKEYPELLDIPENENKYMLEEYRYQWFIKLIQIKERLLIEETERIISLSNSNLSAKQPKVNYTKEIRKRMKQLKTVFIDELMEGFDFREIDLEDAVFINCDLTRANFAHCNLINCIFVNCILDETVFYGAATSNTYAVNGEKEKIIDNIGLYK